MRAGFIGLLRSRQGNAAIEFAVVAPVLLVLTGAIVEVGLLFHIYNQTNRLASQYAAAWSDCDDKINSSGVATGDCQAELTTLTRPATVSNVAPQLALASLDLRMFQVTMAGTNPIVRYSTGGAMTSSQIASAQATLTDKQVGVVVTATYQHSLVFFGNIVSGYIPAALLKPSFTVTQLKS